MYLVELLAVPVSLSVSRQPNRSDAFPHVYRHHLSGLELYPRTVALQELVPRQTRIAGEQHPFEAFEQLLADELDLDFRLADFDLVVATVEETLADCRLAR